MSIIPAPRIPNPTRSSRSSSPAAPAPACGRCRASRRRSRSCRCPTATRCWERPRPAHWRLPGATELVTVTNRDYYFHTKDVYAGLGRRRAARRPRSCSSRSDATPPPPSRSPRRTSQARHGDDAVLLVLPADHLIRDQAGVRAGRDARGGARAHRRARDVRHQPGAARDRLRLHRMRRPASPTPARRAAGVPRAALRRKAAARAGPRIPGRRQLRLEFGDVLLHRGGDPRRVRAACARACSTRSGPVWSALAAKAPSAMQEIDSALFAAVPDISLDYAVMEKAARRRRGGDRPRHVRLERRRLVAGGVRPDRARRRTATAARASASRSPPSAPTCTPRIASSRRSASRTSSSSTRRTPCWSRIATTCSA